MSHSRFFFLFFNGKISEEAQSLPKAIRLPQGLTNDNMLLYIW